MLGRARRRLSACLAGLSAVIAGLALPLAAAGPARADQVRSAEAWVQDALNVQGAWRYSQGGGVLVAVIDSGVDPAASDITGSVRTGPDLTGVGTPESNPGWGVHGTWMASIIAGHGNGPGGQDGIIGVAPRARVLSIRVITDRADPGYARYQSEPSRLGQRQLATAIRYAVGRHANVISMSLGYNEPSVAVRSALQYALSRNVVVVASSGNSGDAATARGRGQAPYSFPADYPGVLGVAAVNRASQPAHFSSGNLSVQVAAPGVNVPAQGRGSRYWLVSGTSPACALTAGVAALIKSRYPRLTAAQVRRAITSTTRNRPHGGYDEQIGFGTVDAGAALTAAARLARPAPAGRLAAAKASASGNFGGGPAQVPGIPVGPRGSRLAVLSIFAGFCLIVVAASVRRLVITGRARNALRLGGSGSPPGYGAGAAIGPAATGANGADGVTGTGGPEGLAPDSGFQGTAVDLRYPDRVFPPQQYPGPPPGWARDRGYPGERQPGRHPGQHYPGQPRYPGQPSDQPGQPPGRPGQAYPGQPPGRPGQAYPGQPQSRPGQAYPGQPPRAPRGPGGPPPERYPGQTYRPQPDRGRPPRPQRPDPSAGSERDDDPPTIPQPKWEDGFQPRRDDDGQ